jgi:hypothetical protein
MSGDPEVPDKYPSLVIPGYIYSAKGEPLTSLTLYRRSRFPRLVVITICLNKSPVVVITTFPNTKRLRLR